MNNFFYVLIVVLSMMLQVTVLTPQYSSAAQVSGKSLYLRHCGQCHGNEGQGFRKLYPPLLHSSLLRDQAEKLPCIIRFGIQGTIEISKNTFNKSMPGNPMLPPSQITAIISYAQSAFTKVKGKEYTPAQIEQWLQECAP